ncbi:DUF4913 domain-containing protein [Microbacterium sp. NPDC055455]
MGLFDKPIGEVIGPLISGHVKPALAAELKKLAEHPQFKLRARKTAVLAVEKWAQDNIAWPSPTRYGDVYEFFDEYVAVMWPANNESRWCAQWWKHPDVVRRLTVMWMSFEARVREKPATGEDEWLRLVGDVHMRILTDKNRGPFASCHHAHRPGQRVRTEQMPEQIEADKE